MTRSKGNVRVASMGFLRALVVMAGVSCFLSFLALPIPLLAAPTLDRIIIGQPTKSLSFFPIIVAESQGLFREEGLEVKFVQIKTSLITPSLLTASLDYTTGFSSTVSAAAAGVRVKALLVIANKPQHLLIARPEIKSVAELRGKRIAINSVGTLTDYEAQAILRVHQVPAEEVTFLSLGGDNNRVTALRAGSVDATLLPVPSNFKMEGLGYRRLENVANVMEVASSGLGATIKKIQESPEEVKKVIRAILRGVAFTKGRREEVIGILQRWYETDRELAVKSYEAVRDTYSDTGIPSEELLRFHIELYRKAAKVDREIPFSLVSDFSLARAVNATLKRR